MIPGLRSLLSLTRGYYLSSLRDSLMQTSILSVCCAAPFLVPVRYPTTRLTWSEGKQ